LRLGSLWVQAAHRASPRMRGQWTRWIPGHHTLPRPASRYGFCCSDWGYVCSRLRPGEMQRAVWVGQLASGYRGQSFSAGLQPAMVDGLLTWGVLPQRAKTARRGPRSPQAMVARAFSPRSFSAVCERGPFRFGVGAERIGGARPTVAPRCGREDGAPGGTRTGQRSEVDEG